MAITIEVFLMTKEKIQDAIYTHRYIYNFHYHLIWVTKYRPQTFATKKTSRWNERHTANGRKR